MHQKVSYIFRTKNFYDPWTWMKRILIFLFLTVGVLYWEWMLPEGMLWKYLFLLLCGLFLALKPVGDLAIDSNYLHHLRTSLLSFFSKEKKYDITEIKSIRAGKIGSTRFEDVESLLAGLSNSIEIVFKDNSSTTLDLKTYKKDLFQVTSKLRELMTENI